MDTRESLLKNIIHQLMRLSVSMVDAHSSPKDYGSGVKLYPAEAHALQAICNHRGASVTELAAFLKVTKGAISQMLKRLENKGFITSDFAPGSEKQKMFSLTEKGRQAHEGHEQHHAHMEEVIMKKMQSFTQQDLVLYQQINAVVEELIEELH